MERRLLKFEATGNDFLVLPSDHFFTESGKAPYWARRLCDRKLGVGADGLLVVTQLEERQAQMVIYNADGSRPEMCGNGVRCIAAFLDHLYPGMIDHPFTVISDAGPRRVVRVSALESLTPHGEQRGIENCKSYYRVEMGRPKLLPEVRLRYKERDVVLHQVNMGNPHAVSFQSELFNDKDLWHLGRYLNSQHPDFPHGVNLEIADLTCGDSPLVTRVYERGVGETKACGTGACAVAVAAIQQKIVQGQSVHVALPGGALEIEWLRQDSALNDQILMTGPANFVAEIVMSTAWIDRNAPSFIC